MRAVVCYGKDELKLEEIPKPIIQEPDEVLIEVKAVGICGSDFALFSGNGPSWSRYPVVPGHEISGVVIDKGPEADKFCVGDAVVIDNYLRCGKCYYCKKGDYFHCEHYREIGFTVNGGLAEFCLIPKTNLFLVPEGLDVKDAVLAEPTATAIRACRKADVRSTDTIVVLGCGPLGVLLVAVAKSMGAARVILAGRGERLKRAQKIGADIAIDTSEQNWPERVLEENNGAQVDFVLEATGSTEIINPAIEIAKAGGTVVLLGITWGRPVSFSVDKMVMKEVSLISSVAGVGCFEEALILLKRGKVNPFEIITHTFPLEEFKKALKYERKRIEGAIKVRIVL